MPKYKLRPPYIPDGYEIVCSECGKTFVYSRPVDRCYECRMVVHETGSPYFVTEINGKTYNFNVRLFHMIKNKPFPYIIQNPYTATSVTRHTSDKWLLKELNYRKPEITKQELLALFASALTEGKYDKNPRSSIITISLVCDSHLQGKDRTPKSKWIVCTLAQIRAFEENQFKLARKLNWEAHKKAEQHFMEGV